MSYAVFSCDLDTVDRHLQGYGFDDLPACDVIYRTAVPRLLELLDQLLGARLHLGGGAALLLHLAAEQLLLPAPPLLDQRALVLAPLGLAQQLRLALDLGGPLL